MKVGYVQTHPNFGEKEKNFQQIEVLLKDVQANLIVLPELFATGYTFISKEEAESLAEDKNGKTAQFLKKMAKSTGAIVVGGFIEREDNDIFNSAMVVSNASVIGSYRKIHLYYKEKLWFSLGNQPIKVFELDDFKLGIMICFDWFFPETARTLAILGADIIAHPANLVLPYCQKAMVTRCLENRVFAITSNRIGQEKRGMDNFTFTGASQITSIDGKILSSAPSDRPHVDFVDIEITSARNKKLNDLNDIIADRRTEYYI